MAQSVTFNSSTGTAAMVLNPVAKTTTVIATVNTATSTGVYQIEMSLDDPSIFGGPTATWVLLSSGTAMTSSQATSLVYSVLSPVAQVRINSTAFDKGQTGITLKALQSVTA
jgi:6-phosphogluconolactonase (cycloisomerase 2 family)